MKLYDEMPTHVLAEYKARGDSTCLPHEKPTRNSFYSRTRPGGILVFLQNNNNMLSVILQQPLYHEILK